MSPLRLLQLSARALLSGWHPVASVPPLCLQGLGCQHLPSRQMRAAQATVFSVSRSLAHSWRWGTHMGPFHCLIVGMVAATELLLLLGGGEGV